jgi:hypothetical protein
MKKENVRNKAYYQGLRLKYLNFAKEAVASDDRVLIEYNLQFAEHYGRVIAERFTQSSHFEKLPVVENNKERSIVKSGLSKRQ